jgi:hypothetical protein
MSSEKESMSSEKELKQLKRCQTIVGTLKRATVLSIKTFVPSVAPPGHTLPDRQVQTSISDHVEESGKKAFVVKHTICLPHLGHIQFFWSNPKLRDLGTEVFADVKEITESAGAFRASADAVGGRQDGSLDAIWGKCLIVVVADGGTPRTASMFAALTNAPEIHSVDPAMRQEWVQTTSVHTEVEEQVAGRPLPDLLSTYGSRLHCHRSRIEDWLESCDLVTEGRETLLVVAVHSHVFLDRYVPLLRGKVGGLRTVVVTIPCCVDQSMEVPNSSITSQADVGVGWTAQRKRKRNLILPVKEFHDYGIHSNHRIIRIFDTDTTK